MKVRTLGSIREVAPASWDALTDGDPVFGHAWFRALESAELGIAEPRHITLEHAGTLCAVLPCFVQTGDPHATLVGRLLGPSLAPFGPGRALVAYAPLAQRSAFFAAPEVDRAEALRLLSAEMDRICRDEQLALSGWPFVEDGSSLETGDRSEPAAPRAPQPPHPRPLIHELGHLGYRTGFLAPAARWTNPGYQRFEDYLEALSRVGRKRYRAARNEINRFARTGVELVDRALSSVSPTELARMQAEHARRQGARPFVYPERFFLALQRELAADARVHLAYADDSLLSYSIVIRGRGRWHMFLCGDRDAESAHRDKLHFNLNYYFPMRRAIETQTRVLDYGLSTYTAKLQRGCTLHPVSFAVRAHRLPLRVALPGWTRAVDRWYRRKHRDLAGDAAGD